VGVVKALDAFYGLGCSFMKFGKIDNRV